GRGDDLLQPGAALRRRRVRPRPRRRGRARGDHPRSDPRRGRGVARRLRRARPRPDLPGRTVLHRGADRLDRRRHPRVPLRHVHDGRHRCPRRGRERGARAGGAVPDAHVAAGRGRPGRQVGRPGRRGRGLRRRCGRRLGGRHGRGGRRRPRRARAGAGAAGRRPQRPATRLTRGRSGTRPGDRVARAPTGPLADGPWRYRGGVSPAVVTLLANIPSPDRGVWMLGPIPIRAYALCIIAGIVVAVLWGERRFVARGGEQGVVTDVAVFAVPFGLVGGRLYHVITDWRTYFGPGGDPLGALRIWEGGLGIWG